MVLGRGISFRLRVSGFLLLGRRCLDGRRSGSGFFLFVGFSGVSVTNPVSVFIPDIYGSFD